MLFLSLEEIVTDVGLMVEAGMFLTGPHRPRKTECSSPSCLLAKAVIGSQSTPNVRQTPDVAESENLDAPRLLQ